MPESHARRHVQEACAVPYLPSPPDSPPPVRPSWGWLSPSAVAAKSKRLPNHHRGIFARKNIRSGDTVCVMGGRVVHIHEHNAIGSFGEEYGIDISEDFSFCPANERELELMPQCLINHSCAPNLGFVDTVRLVAIRDIAAGEELTYDYAFILYRHPENDFEFRMDCRCGAPEGICRKRITVDDWKRPELHERYGEWFQPFLKRRFAALKRQN